MTDSIHPLLHQLASTYGLEVRFDGESVHLNHPEQSKSATLDLVAIRRLAHQAEPHDFRVWLSARFKMAAHALSSSSAVVQTQLLMPHIRPRRRPGEPHWSQPLANEQLSVALVEDHGETFRLMQPMQLVQTGQSIQQLMEQAGNHLRQISSAVHFQKHPLSDCLHCTAADGHSASRALIIHEVLHDSTGWLFLIPSRDQLWLIPASSTQALDIGLALKARAADHAATDPYPISAELFINRQGRIQHITGPE